MGDHRATVARVEEWIAQLVRPVMHQFTGRSADRLADSLPTPVEGRRAKRRARSLALGELSARRLVNELLAEPSVVRETVYSRRAAGCWLVSMLTPEEAKDANRAWLEGCVWAAVRACGLGWDRRRRIGVAETLRNQLGGRERPVVDKVGGKHAAPAGAPGTVWNRSHPRSLARTRESRVDGSVSRISPVRLVCSARTTNQPPPDQRLSPWGDMSRRALPSSPDNSSRAAMIAREKCPTGGVSDFRNSRLI